MPGAWPASATPSAFQNAVAAVDAAREQRGDRLKADASLAHLAGSPPSPRTIELRRRRRRAARDPDALALEVARPRDLRLGDDGGQRACTRAMTPTMSRPFSRAQGQVVDVEDRELRAPGEQAA
jgi:hypothetical protein